MTGVAGHACTVENGGSSWARTQRCHGCSVPEWAADTAVLYESMQGMFRWGLGNIYVCALLKEPLAAQAGTGHLPRSIFLAKNCASWFALSESSDYIHDITADFQVFHPFAVELIYTIIFQQMLGNRPSKSVFANYHHRWNVSGEIVYSHLAGRSLAWW